MSSWTNKDLYVAYGFGTSSVNGYYFPDSDTNSWYNSTNNVSLAYTGTQWWLRQKIPTDYLHYYYGAEDDGSGICAGLIFASNSVYEICEGILPIGEVIYAGEEIQSTSSSSSSSSEGHTSSSSSSSGFEDWALCSIAQFPNMPGILAKINMITGEMINIGETEKIFNGIAQQDNSILYGFTHRLPIGEWGPIDPKMYRINPDTSITEIKDDMKCLACVISDLSYEATPGLYLIDDDFSLNKYEIGTWNLISSYSIYGIRPDLVYFTALVIHNGIMYISAWYIDGGGYWKNKLVRINSFSPFSITDICDIPNGTTGLVSINNRLYGAGLDAKIFSVDLISQTYTINAWQLALFSGLTNLVEGFAGSSSSAEESLSTEISETSEQSEAPGETLELFQVLINQGHHDLIPFSYTIERGQDTSSTFGFNYRQVSNTISYSSILNFNTISASTTSVFVPETEDAKYKHEPIFYTDIIVEGQGVDKYSLRSQQESYIKEDPTTVFNIPKFTWDNSIFGVIDESESSIDPENGFVWIGTSDKFINKVEYFYDHASLVFRANAPSEVHMITFGNQDNNTYITCYDHLIRYICASYFSGSDFDAEQAIFNNTNDLMVLDDEQSGYLICAESYQGKIIFRDRLTLDVVSEYDGFDAPFKVLWSQAHNCYLIAGTHTLWKFSNGQKTAVYNIKDYSIVDFDCSENGVVGIIFKGINYIIRFLDSDLYSMLYNEIVTDKEIRYCKYCEQGKFYILQEVNNGDVYATVSYLFDSIAKTLTITESENSIVTTTTTTTLPIPSSRVEIIEPVFSSVWQKGNDHNIRWLSNASLNDSVKIELYKGSMLIDTITPQTNNTGIYVWNIATAYANGTDYKIKITWLSAGDTTQFDLSNAFTLTDLLQTTSTTTTRILDKAIGIGYDKSTGQAVIVLSNGLIGIYDIENYEFNGLFESGVNHAYCMAIKDRKTKKFRGVSKVRVYVGSEPYLNNMWDYSFETNLNSVYYGGDKLIPGEKYFVNIQVYSDKYGWSSVQTKQFIMPK